MTTAAAAGNPGFTVLIRGHLPPVRFGSRTQFVKDFGVEADRHLLRALFSAIDFSSDAPPNPAQAQTQNGLLIRLLSEELIGLLTKPQLVGNVCYAVDNLLPQQKVSGKTCRKFSFSSFFVCACVCLCSSFCSCLLLLRLRRLGVFNFSPVGVLHITSIFAQISGRAAKCLIDLKTLTYFCRSEE